MTKKIWHGIVYDVLILNRYYYYYYYYDWMGQLEGQQTWRTGMTCNCCVSNCSYSFTNTLLILTIIEFLGALMHQVRVLQSADVDSVIKGCSLLSVLCFAVALNDSEHLRSIY